MGQAAYRIGFLVFLLLVASGAVAAWVERRVAADGFGIGLGLGIGLAAAFGVINWAVSALDRLKG